MSIFGYPMDSWVHTGTLVFLSLRAREYTGGDLRNGAVTLPNSRVNAWITHKIRVLRDTSAICAFHQFFWRGTSVTLVVRRCSPYRRFTWFQVLTPGQQKAALISSKHNPCQIERETATHILQPYADQLWSRSSGQHLADDISKSILLHTSQHWFR